MTEKEIIGILKQSRKEKKMTLITASSLLGLHRNSLSRMESGKIDNIKYDFLERYARILDMDIVLIKKMKV